MCDSVCFCFSGAPLGAKDMESKKGSQYARYQNNVEKFQTTMCNAPCKTPGCCLLGGCPFTCLCTTFHMRYKALNHVTPGSGWDHYICCQGYL